MTDPIEAAGQAAATAETAATSFAARARAWLKANWLMLAVAAACFVAGAVLF